MSSRLLYLKLLLYALVPIILGALSFAVWKAVEKIKNKTKEETKQNITSTIIIVMFIIHPTIVTFYFQIFK